MTLRVRELKSVLPPLQWEPVVGDETSAFAERKHFRSGVPQSALEGVVHEARQILGRCANPQEEAKGTTGLVVGYVQSGKTLSFTTLTALAHDNGFGLIVVIAGTKDNLREQTRIRLRDDLGIGHAAKPSPWIAIDNPRPGSHEDSLLKKCIKDWANSDIPRRRKRAGLVMVLKQHQRIANLAQCLSTAQMAHVPVLVIDDEADQATPNTFAARNLATGTTRRSANYREILRLKNVLPHHTYVQYTATPQATLLMSLQDQLSPEFAELLTPGDGYVGGATFFKAPSPYVKTIPPADVSVTVASSATPPESLVKAVRVFLLGACVVEAREDRAVRTMMAHPSQQTDPHNDYLRWIEGLRESWSAMLQDGPLTEQLRESFLEAFTDLQQTESDLPTFESLFALLPRVLATTAIREVNSTARGKAAVDWSASDYWILVGGAKLDRGFTVEGLSVTYMPRPLGDGSADSIQQRARFCGYKKSYLGLCRVYLERNVRHAFEQYVEHEKDIHRTLNKTRGYPLKNWYREFVLDASMQPTRRGVIGVPLKTFAAKNWVHPTAAHRAPSNADLNSDVYKDLLNSLAAFRRTRADEAHPGVYIDRRQHSPRNMLYEDVPLELVLDQFLRKLKYSDLDDQFTVAAAILALRKLMEDEESPVLTTSVFEMGEFQAQNRGRRNGDRINEVFSGRQPDGNIDRSNLNYSGDRDFISGGLSLHIRRFNIVGDGTFPDVNNVPWFAIHIPDHLGKRLVIQV